MIKIIEKNIIHLIKKEKNVSEIARELNVSRPTIYAWKTRYEEDWLLWFIDDPPWPKYWKAWNRTSKEIEDKVVEYLRVYPEYWPKTIKDHLLEKEWIFLNSTTIWRIGKRRHIRYWITVPKEKRKRTLYSLSSPWELQVDVSFPYWRSKHIWAYNAIDDCTRWVYWDIVEEYGVNESINFVRDLLVKTPFKVHTIRTDNGKEFGKLFTDYLESIWIKHIKNEPYMPQHNGKIERYHGTWKRLEVIFRDKTMELDKLKYRNQLRLQYYNTKRKHTGLWMDGLTPLKKLLRYLYCSQCVKLSMQQDILNILKIKVL